MLGQLNSSFLDASSHLSNRICPSVRRSVDPSVRHAFVKNKGNQYFNKAVQYTISNILLFKDIFSRDEATL